MSLESILNFIDLEISRLQQARAMLAEAPRVSVKKSVGRPKKVTVAKPASNPKRIISAEGKARIAAAQKKRWAATKKSSK
jgi:hypothetical protein